MNNYFDEYDRKIFEAMKNKDWWIDKFKARKIELIRSCRRINSNSSISRKIGGLLLWQQVIEQFLKEINQISSTRDLDATQCTTFYHHTAPAVR